MLINLRHIDWLVKFCLGLALYLSPLWSQGVISGQDAGVWNQGSLVFLPRSPFSPEAARIYAPGSLKASKIPRPPYEAAKAFGNVCFSEGHFFWYQSFKSQTPEGSFQIEELFRFEEAKSKWALYATFRHQGGPIKLFPLKGDLFLGMSIHPDTFTNTFGSFPFGVLVRREDGVLKIKECLDTGLEKPFFSKLKKRNYPSLMLYFMQGEYANSGDFLIIGSKIGLFWIFDQNTGRLKRTVSLFPSIDGKAIEKGTIARGVLGFQARPDGEVLIAARQEDFFLRALIDFPVPEGTAPDTSGVHHGLGQLDRWTEFTCRIWPVIDWWTLDPLTGKVRSEYPPAGVTARLSTTASLMDFNWRFMPDGNLLVYTRQEKNPKNSDPELRRNLGLD